MPYGTGKAFVDDVNDYQLRLTHMRHNATDWYQKFATEWCSKLVVDEIRKRMENARFSEKIIQATWLVKVEQTNTKIRCKIKSEFFSETGFDVAVAREKGTKRHFVKPNVANALSWIVAGVRLFSKGHWVSGIKSLRIIKHTIEEKKPVLQAKMDEEFTKWMARIFTE